MNWDSLNSEFKAAQPPSFRQRLIGNLFGWPDAPFQRASADSAGKDAKSQFNLFAMTAGYSEALRNDLQSHAKRLEKTETDKRKWYYLFAVLSFLLLMPICEFSLQPPVAQSMNQLGPLRYDQMTIIGRLAFLLITSLVAAILYILLARQPREVSKPTPEPPTPESLIKHVLLVYQRSYLRLIIFYALWFLVIMTLVVAMSLIQFMTSPGMDQWLVSARLELVGLSTIGMVFTIVVLLSIPLVILTRLVRYITYRGYMDTLCVARAIDILIDLSRNELLTNPDSKAQLIHRLNHLAGMTNLLASRFTSDDKSTQGWTQDHFRHIASYVRERAQWVAAPRETTLNALREDFDWLSTIYISGSYGEFKYAADKKNKDKPQKKEQRWRDGLRLGTKFVLGIALPIVLILLIQNLPPNELVLGLFEPSIANLLLIAWILLFIDANLKLGIVAGLTGLAKGVREIK
jgi:hypothetical protein